MVGLFFFVVNFALSRLSRRLEIRERERTGTKMRRVAGSRTRWRGRRDLAGPPR